MVIRKLVPGSPTAGRVLPVNADFEFRFAVADARVQRHMKNSCFDAGYSASAAAHLVKERQALSDAIGWASQ